MRAGGMKLFQKCARVYFSEPFTGSNISKNVPWPPWPRCFNFPRPTTMDLSQIGRYLNNLVKIYLDQHGREVSIYLGQTSSLRTMAEGQVLYYTLHLPNDAAQSTPVFLGAKAKLSPKLTLILPIPDKIATFRYHLNLYCNQQQLLIPFSLIIIIRTGTRFTSGK